MGQNKAQKKAAERNKKAIATEVQPAEVEQKRPTKQPEVKAEAKPAPAATAPSKQQATLDKLKEAWAAKGIDLSKLEAKPDGKFLLVTVAAGWPVIQLGPTGGIVLPQIRSYAKAWDAAVDGLAVFEKQNARDAKKTAAATTPAPKAAEKVQATA